MSLIYVPLPSTSFHPGYVVEQRKTRLTAKQSLRSNVDWLTEVIRRFSEAHALGLDLSTVSMSNVFRCEKVRGQFVRFPS